MKALRTPDAAFENLPTYRFEPHYTTIPDGTGGTLRMHHVDQGPAEAAPILCLHGEPTWSYLYRKMIPVFAEAGHRVLAPDLVGFGKSDKPTERSDYTYRAHIDWLTSWVMAQDPADITLVCQDWGGLIGLRLIAAMPERFARVVVANTALPTGDEGPWPAFEAWRDYSQSVDPFNAGRIVYGATARRISDQDIAAYNAPFPDERYKAGARQFPMLVPTRPDDPASEPNRAAWRVLRGLDLPVLTVFGADDKVMAGVENVFQARMPGAAGQAHQVLPDAGHFLQEDVGPELAQATLAFISSTSQRP